MKKALIILICLCSLAVAQDTLYRILNSFNAGELSPLLNAREDLSKYQAGLSVMENMIPLPQGAAQKRPGTVYVAESKENTKIRMFPFGFSTTQTYGIEAGNQYFRFYTDNAGILGGSGTEDLSSLDNIKAHWLLNDDAANTVVTDDDGATHNGVSSANTEDIHTEGQVGTGCFELDGQYAVAITDHADFTFVEGTDGDFSIASWIYVTEVGVDQSIVSKWYERSGREWRLLLDSSRKLKFCLADESLLLDTDLRAHWKLNDSAATSTVVDALGTHNGAMDDGSNDYTSDHSVTGKVDNAFDMDGTDDRVQITDHADFTFGDGSSTDSPFSISAWINMDDATSFPILTKREPLTNHEWAFYCDSSDKLVVRLYDVDGSIYIGRTYSTALTAQQGSWIHVVMTYDATEASSGINLYLDGSDVDNGDSQSGSYSAMHNSAGNVYIAHDDEDNTYANGKIDNVMLFDKELSSAEVTAIYNGGSGTEDLDTQYISAISDDALSTGWRFVTITYEGEHGSWTGATAADYITMYVDGAAIASTATNLSTYSVMEDTSAQPRIGAQFSTAGAIEKIYADKIDEVAVFNDVLSAAEVASLYDVTDAYEITTPYLTADLFELKYEQSADVLYISHPDYETKKLSRLNNDDWPLDAIAIENGPFRTQNDDTGAKIAASATTGSITLTATGCAPFIAGTTAGHLPSGSVATSKSQTGALFKLVHPLDTLEYSETLTNNYTSSQVENTSWMDCGTVYEGSIWYVTTLGTWTGVLEIQRNYTIGAAHGASGWETAAMQPFASKDDRNVTTDGTEDIAAASYRAILTESGDASETCKVYFRTNQTEHVGIVEITAITSTTLATATVLTTLASTDATHKWSEGSWSNYRGWPRAITFFEDRLTFGGNASQPDTIWASVTADYENMLEGSDDDDALSFTLSSKQVNIINWLIGKDKILIGTSGAEWTLGGSADEPLTPSNVKAEQHSTYGSADLQATQASESVLFFQRGAEKMRELAYNWETDAYVAPDMTLLVPEVTGDGITDVAYQQTPNSILWCVRDDGQMAIFVYERKELITSWSRLITDGSFESVMVITGDPEDEVWVSVNRTIGGATKRYIEYFSARDFGSDVDDAFFVDSGVTYDSTATTTITGLAHLNAETVAVLGDGAVQTSQTVSSGQITITSASTVQAGLPFTVQMRTMPLSWFGGGSTIQGRVKRINEVIARYYNSGDFDIGKDISTKNTLSISDMATGEERMTFPAGYDRPGYVFVYQQSPEPLTLVALMIEFMAY